MVSDEYKLRAISKRYTRSSTLKSWNFVSPKTIETIERILETHKTQVIESLPNRQQTLRRADIELSHSISQFIQRLTPELSESGHIDEELNENKLKLPKMLNENDLDYDFQLKKNRFLENLLGNELKLVDNLYDAIITEKKEKKMWTRFASDYKRMYTQELNNLKKEMDAESNDRIENELNRSHQGCMLDIDFEENKEEEAVLQELESHLEKLRKHTDHLSDLSTQLDSLNQALDFLDE